MILHPIHAQLAGCHLAQLSLPRKWFGFGSIQLYNIIYFAGEVHLKHIWTRWSIKSVTSLIRILDQNIYCPSKYQYHCYHKMKGWEKESNSGEYYFYGEIGWEIIVSTNSFTDLHSSLDVCLLPFTNRRKFVSSDLNNSLLSLKKYRKSLPSSTVLYYQRKVSSRKIPICAEELFAFVCIIPLADTGGRLTKLPKYAPSKLMRMNQWAFSILDHIAYTRLSWTSRSDRLIKFATFANGLRFFHIYEFSYLRLAFHL